MTLWRLVSRLPQWLVFWSLVIAEGLLFFLCFAGVLGFALSFLVDASRTVELCGLGVAFLIGAGLTLDSVRKHEGWGYKVVPDFRHESS